MMIKIRLLAFAIIIFSSVGHFVQAGTVEGVDHYVGLTYLSGAQDVFSWHDDHLNVDTTEGLPFALGYRFAYNWDSGLRADAGIGPMVFIFGDVSYFDIPLQTTIGYNIPMDSLTPYVRAGLSIHFIDGDYVSNNDTIGALAAVGVKIPFDDDYGMFVEAAYDTAKVTFSNQGSFLSKGAVNTEDVDAAGFAITIGMSF